MTYSETTDFLFNQFPVYQSIGQSAYKADLTNITAILDVLEHPEKEFKSIHVAGTNGKGSVTHLLASVFQEAGYKTGIYCSPHLLDFRERMKVNGQMISEQEVIAFVEEYSPLVQNIQPSFFEYTTAMAFQFFANEKVDIAIVEVGLGGRLDSTNVIVPELSVITNIGLDHTNILGSTLAEIAFEKAGIIKKGIPSVVGQKIVETENVFVKAALDKGSFLQFVSSEKLNFESDLKGIYQQENMRTAYAALLQMRAMGWRIGDENIQQGFLHVQRNTEFMGRWQQLAQHPSIVCDTGHNAEGIACVVEQLKLEQFKTLHIVWGSVNDKDQNKIMPLLPKDARYYFCAPNIARALPVEELKRWAAAFHLYGEGYTSADEALRAARSAASADDFIFIGGSTFVVADVLEANSYR